jgi:predicted 3-demethylubiquinone-9 3-methyltransferase (glyoxalase superfamily)
MPTITPFLWFNDNAEEAANFYVSIFKNSKVMDISRYGEGSPYPAGTAMIVNFQLDGRDYMALNGGPEFKFTEAFSLFVSVKTQEDVDDLWERLSEGGEKGPCGWLKDKFGLSWQIIPTKLGELLGGPDPVKAQRAMQAMLQMGKIDSVALQRAYDQD